MSISSIWRFSGYRSIETTRWSLITCVFDLENQYFHVQLSEEAQQYFGFSWTNDHGEVMCSKCVTSWCMGRSCSLSGDQAHQANHGLVTQPGHLCCHVYERWTNFGWDAWHTRRIILRYAAINWSTLQPSELCRTLQSYAKPYWVTPRSKFNVYQLNPVFYLKSVV
jgi:hypothetical protein